MEDGMEYMHTDVGHIKQAPTQEVDKLIFRSLTEMKCQK